MESTPEENATTALPISRNDLRRLSNFVFKFMTFHSSFAPVRRVAAPVPKYSLADGGNAPLEATTAKRRILVETRLAGVELVVGAIARLRDVWHDHVSAGEKSLFAPFWIKRLKSCRGGDVHIVQIKARSGDHAKT